MSHDIQAAWAAAELARVLQTDAGSSVIDPPQRGSTTVYAGREGKGSWPVADGVIHIDADSTSYSLAMEFKRPEEGLHGILTALGQAFAYLHKGHNGSLIVIPKAYSSHESPGPYLQSVVDATNRELRVGVFSYEEPDPSRTSPFEGRITCIRRFALSGSPSASRSTAAAARRVETQWAHIREGSSTPDAFYRYLLTARSLPPDGEEPRLKLPPELIAAIGRRHPGAEVGHYLSNTAGDDLKDRTWRRFWFTYAFHQLAVPIWSGDGHPYSVNREPTRLLRADGSCFSEFWSARSDSIKNKLVHGLNTGVITEDEAWEEYADNVRERAHSLREDIDSGLEHLGLLDMDGRPTDLGHRFVDVCQRAASACSSVPLSILRAALIQKGQYGALLHYIHRLSEGRFRQDLLAFTTITGPNDRARLAFSQGDYRQWLADQLATELRVMRTVSQRGGAERGTERKPLQAELAIMGQLGIVPSERDRFRAGVGLVIDWPTVQEAMQYAI